MDVEVMEFDVVIVGAGPSGLAAACRLMQGARAAGRELSVCVLEKGSEVGAHIVSGAVFDPRALDELFPDWASEGAPTGPMVAEDGLYWLSDAERSRRLPGALVPKSLHNLGHEPAHRLISAADLCRWLAERAEALGVDLFPGFAAQSLIIEQEQVRGVVTGALGIAADGSEKPGYAPGMELRARHTLFAEGSRGHLGKQLIERFALAQGRATQHHAIGLKEIWEIPQAQHRPGRVQHGAGWPLGRGSHGGWFLYHLDAQRVAVGLIVDLDYTNPWLSPFEEFQRLKHHPLIRAQLEGGERLGYAARALTKGGPEALPKLAFPGGALLGCDAGTLDVSRIKGLHMAMKSGMVAADTLLAASDEALELGRGLADFDTAWADSWAGREHAASQGFGAALHRLGPLLGGAWNLIDQWLGKRLPKLTDPRPDHASLREASEAPRIDYPKADNRLSFDRLSSVYLTNVYHEEDQPCHLHLADAEVPIRDNLPHYAEPATRYCPAAVYEVVEEQGQTRFRINFQNCIHCKTCDIKDPAQNITWVPPEGGNGPNYRSM
ncbi:electron transfer flavoprotein-ubiquinone oxidoreductase [Halotalea alkalilenta]|uniref:electron transfer flavoprotein-ubiquinone oxidoreductase n=1 Tax=Halotalea alkalilenta TaxID=376489 RepID=UPI0005BD1A94|nr:electron transfer flavoprotein-ubiquinone oxidoreductase [Halotalea alkalilenta]